MYFVLLASHTPDTCPTSNAQTRELLLKTAPEMPKVADNLGVTIVAGPFVNREHTIVSIVQSDRPESVDRFLVETRMSQWNRVRILPSLAMDEGMKELQEQTPIF